jgi:tRNA threonylcarbamoyladenosine modification (KEOPS) complex  Pcc1 subunit
LKPANIPITIYQGATFYKEFQWKSGTPLLPVNITGYTARMQIRETIKSPDVLIELTTGNNNNRITITNPTDGRFVLEISATDTASLNFKSGVYDLELISSTGKVTRLFGGNVTFSPEVTR